ncbi:MAG: hypothetical protein EON96_21145 [Caulobacteraceae bacterium]|nr:MAG: hypothetical protein EON96_21145 [Caulobacteraceae bacterium]
MPISAAIKALLLALGVTVVSAGPGHSQSAYTIGEMGSGGRLGYIGYITDEGMDELLPQLRQSETLVVSDPGGGGDITAGLRLTEAVNALGGEIVTGRCAGVCSAVIALQADRLTVSAGTVLLFDSETLESLPPTGAPRC